MNVNIKKFSNFGLISIGCLLIAFLGFIAFQNMPSRPSTPWFRDMESKEEAISYGFLDLSEIQDGENSYVKNFLASIEHPDKPADPLRTVNAETSAIIINKYDFFPVPEHYSGAAKLTANETSGKFSETVQNDTYSFVILKESYNSNTKTTTSSYFFSKVLEEKIGNLTTVYLYPVNFDSGSMTLSGEKEVLYTYYANA